MAKKKIAKKAVKKKAANNKTVKKKIAKKAVKKKATNNKTAKKKIASKKASLKDRLKSAKRSMDRIRSKSANIGEKLFGECVKQLFKDHPDLQTFSWPQYTPHWNDGDELVFSTHFYSLAVNGEEEPECLDTLEHMNDLLSNRQKSEARIVMELSGASKDRWEDERLKNDLDIVKTRDPKEVADKYRMKKAIHELLTSIDDSVYQHMFGEGLVVVGRDGINVENYEHD